MVDDKWSWGYVNGSEENRFLEVNSQEVDPCIPIERPEAPDFNAPGRRISHVKCFEYMWNIKMIANEVKQNSECAAIFLDIVGGRDSRPQENPHMAAIGWNGTEGGWKFKCGGSLISNKFVLTAAHCSMASERDTSIVDVRPKIVRLGVTNIIDTQGRLDVEILKVINHPDYKAPKKYNDLALIELNKEVEFTEFIYPACVITENDADLIGQKAIIVGWGVIEMGSQSTSSILQEAEIDILDSRLCGRLFRTSCNRLWCGLRDDQLCAGNILGGVDACQGDSGGPLQLRIPLPNGREELIYRVIGVTSFGVGCALPKLPGIYTRVSSFIDWIEDIVWK